MNAVSLVDPLHDAGWERSLDAFPGATAFHSAAWLRVLAETYGFRPIGLLARRGDAVVGCLPLVEAETWLTPRRGIALPFTDECRILGDAPARAALVERALAEGDRRAWRYCEFRDSGAQDEATPAQDEFLGHELRLEPDPEAVFARFDGAVRQAVRKAQRGGLRIEFSSGPEAMRDYYALHCLTRQRHGTPPQPYAFFSNLQRLVLATGGGQIVSVRTGERTVAAAVFLHRGRNVIYKFGASDEAFQALRANNLAMWSAIAWYAERGYATLDFGRTDRANEGLRRYKRSWGTEERRVRYYRFDRRSRRYTAGRPGGGWTARMFRRLPVPVARLIGLALYRHVA